MEHRVEKEAEGIFSLEVTRYQDFKEWLSKRFGVAHKEALGSVEDQYDDVFGAVLKL